MAKQCVQDYACDEPIKLTYSTLRTVVRKRGNTKEGKVKLTLLHNCRKWNDEKILVAVYDVNLSCMYFCFFYVICPFFFTIGNIFCPRYKVYLIAWFWLKLGLSSCHNRFFVTFSIQRAVNDMYNIIRVRICMHWVLSRLSIEK